MTIKNIEKTKTEYAIEVEKEDLLKILNQEDDDVYLCDHLDAMPGVSDSTYSGHFGPFIYLTVETDSDNEGTWEQIREKINQ